MRKYILSIVIDCTKHSSEHIHKSIKSILENLTDRQKIEIILMNREVEYLSNDENCQIVDCFEKDIIASLNLAKSMAKGEYISFITAGDIFYKNSLQKISEFVLKNEFTLLHCSLINSHSQYQIEKTFGDKQVIAYDSELYNHLPTKIKGCFFLTENIKDIQFLSTIGDSFESYFFSEFISASDLKCLKILSSVISYMETDVFVQSEDIQLSNYLLHFINNCNPHCFQQYYAIIELKKLLEKKSIKHRDEAFDENQKEQFILKVKEILNNISKEIIINTSSLILQYKNYFLNLKFGKNFYNELEVKNVKLENNKKQLPYVTYKDELLFNITNIGNFKINILESKNNILILDGIEVFSFLEPNYKIVAIDNQNRIYEPHLYGWPLLDKKGFVGEKIYLGRRFRFEIPLNDIKKIRFAMKNDSGHEFALIPSFGVYSKLVKRLKMSYYAKDNCIIKYNKKGLSIYKNSFISHCKCELKLWIQLLKKKKLTIIWMRFLYYIMKFINKKPIWLIRDNEKRAKDSGAEMFKYFSQWEKNSIAKAYFILDKNCSDYAIMRKYGKIIQPDSFKYKLYHLLADKLIDTRGGINCQYVFKDDADYVKDLCRWDYVWLIHGIMTRNESTWTNRFVLNAKLFATCNTREYASVLDENNGYGYESNEVALTGLPRHDALNANKQKKILFLPTWRKHLAGDLIPGTSDRSYVDNFKETDYYQFYNSLINDKRLLKVMKEKGYTGDFYLHPSFMKQCHDFQENDIMRVGKEPADTNRLIGECSILVTDYSSAQFEGAYLDTPVIYPQYDADTFSDNHTGNDGYFDYEKDGFGPVCYDLDATVNAIIQYLNNDCQNVEPYVTRAKEFFVYRDKDNSRRVFEQILKISGYGNNEFHVEKDEQYVSLYQGNQLKNIEKIEDGYKVYNPVFKMLSFVRDIHMNEKSFIIEGGIGIDKNIFPFQHVHFNICIGKFEKMLDFHKYYKKHKKEFYEFKVEIPYDQILLTKKSTPIILKWEDGNGYGYYSNLKCQCVERLDILTSQRNRKLCYSNVHILGDHKTSIFVRETLGNNAYLCVRDVNYTDQDTEQKKLYKAYLLSKILWFHKARNSVLCFEKFSSKYEESASVLFEKIIDNGEKNTYFVIDKNSLHYQNIPEKYRKYIIPKYSFKHYFYFFLARAFIATESMNHMIELNICDPHVTMRIANGAYDYIFLQHGVMYMYCLENRSDFIKGEGFTNYSKVVVSSQTEANHFIEYGQFEQDDLIVSGLPKFDRNYCKPDADKILIMPTSRDFEYNVIRLTPTESTYYRFVKNIINAIPDELKSKIVVVGHPLLKDQLYATDLKKYMPKDFIYNDLLSETKLLITDYSSISYDAFYRGSNVIFCWEDKELCLNAMNYKLMLNKSNVFADVSEDFSDLKDLIIKNYNNPQSEDNIKKYREIVSFFDNHNTDRCYEALLKYGYYGKRKHVNIANCEIKHFTKKVFTGHVRRHERVELYFKGKILVKNRDYKIYYLNNKRRTKMAIAIFVGKRNYFGVKIKRFRISKSIRYFEVLGVHFENNKFNLSQLAVKGDGKFLKRDQEYTVKFEDGPVDDSVYLVITGKKQYGGKIKLLYRIENS